MNRSTPARLQPEVDPAVIRFSGVPRPADRRGCRVEAFKKLIL